MRSTGIIIIVFFILGILFKLIENNEIIHSELKYTLDKRGSGGGNIIQSVIEMPSLDVLYTLHESKGKRIINKFRLSNGTHQIAERWSKRPTALIGHQGLGFEYTTIANNKRKFWSSGNFANEVVRFEINDDLSDSTNLKIEQIEKYILWDANEVLSYGKRIGKNASPTISTDGKYLIAELTGLGLGTVRVFDLNRLIYGGPGNYSDDYVHQFNTSYELIGCKRKGNFIKRNEWDFDGNNRFDFPVQSIASDGKYIYILSGDGNINHEKKLVRYTIDGSSFEEVCDFNVGQPTKAYIDNSSYYELESLYLNKEGDLNILAVTLVLGSPGKRINQIYYVDLNSLKFVKNRSP